VKRKRKVWWIIIGAVVLALLARLLTKTAQAKTQTAEAETAVGGVGGGGVLARNVLV